MKKLIIIAIALFTLNVSAKENPVKPNTTLRTEIVQILGKNYPDLKSEAFYKIEVLFTINSKSEIIVLSANAPNQYIENYIKNKLNYKKVNFISTKVGELFLLPITIKQS